MIDKLVSKEVIAAFIGASVLIGGYIWTARSQQDLERYQNKAAAYSNFLNQVELNLRTVAEQASEPTLTYNDQIRKLNAALAVLETNAPNCVVQNIYHEVFNDGGSVLFSVAQIKVIQLILHNDLYGQTCVSTELTTSSFMSFYLK